MNPIGNGCALWITIVYPLFLESIDELIKMYLFTT
jgi:hypothetical protein